MTADAGVTREAAVEVIRSVTGEGGTARTIGGLAVAIRCPTASRHPALMRTYADLDLVVRGDSTKVVDRVLEEHGFAADRRFNALHGRQRRLYKDAGGTQVDVFVDEFAMCHRLPLADRLDTHPLTISLADLLLSKLQIAELNRKDVLDTLTLLIEHDLSEDESGINVRRISWLLGTDWGWWRTTTENLQKLSRFAVAFPGVEEFHDTVEARIDRILSAVDATPKSVRWRLRARVGEKVPWRDEPEEVAR